MKIRDGCSLWFPGQLPLWFSLTPWLIFSREIVLFISYWPYCANWEIYSYQPLYKPFLVSVSIFPSQHSSLEQLNCILLNLFSLFPTRCFLRSQGLLAKVMSGLLLCTQLWQVLGWKLSFLKSSLNFFSPVPIGSPMNTRNYISQHFQTPFNSHLHSTPRILVAHKTLVSLCHKLPLLQSLLTSCSKFLLQWSPGLLAHGLSLLPSSCYHLPCLKHRWWATQPKLYNLSSSPSLLLMIFFPIPIPL